MYRLLLALTLVGATAFAQATQTPADRSKAAAENTKDRAKDTMSNDAVTHGTIKEFTPGQKVVVAVDNAPDKTFDLTDKDVKVTVAKSMKVGDHVKVSEHSVMGKTKTATITKDDSAPAKAKE